MRRVSRQNSGPQCGPYGMRSAFTLIELLLVMVIIAILAAIVVPRLTGRREQANVSAAKQQVSNFKTELDLFEKDNARFPTTEEGLNALVTNPANLSEWKRYTDSIPPDPWGHPYVYHCPGTNGRDYDVYSCGPSGQDQQGGGDNIQ
jgi:general secretion pathway protein G